MWADPVDGLPEVLRRLALDCRCNETRLEVTFPNGSVIRLMGADRGAWGKLRGQKLDLLVVDESQKAEDEGFDRALSQVIPDCLAARHGRFRAIGTPDEFCVGTFHDLCTSRPPPWSVHHWTAEDLDGVTAVWQEQLRWKAEHGIADDDPVWLREKRGEWVRQDDRLMLPLYDQSFWSGDYPENIPALGGALVKRTKPIEHYMGLDWGWSDSAALVVLSVSREEGIGREVYSWKSPALDADALAEVVRAAVAKHGVKRIYADPSRPEIIESFARKWRLPIVKSEVADKTGWIQDMRGKARMGRLKVLRGSLLHEELETLVPDPKAARRKRLEPLPGSEDHCFDAFRYVYRGVFPEFIRAPEPPMSVEDRAMAEVQRQREELLGIRRPTVRRDDIHSVRLTRRPGS